MDTAEGLLTAEMPPPPETLRVLVLAPIGRDGELLVRSLTAAGIPAQRVDSAADLVRMVEEDAARDGMPEVGAVVATDEALAVEWSTRLVEALDRQPSWSDIPVVLLASQWASADRRWRGSAPGPLAERLTARASVTVLDRPVRIAALVSAVRAVLRARERQVQVRQLIESLARAQAYAERAAAAKSEFLAMMSHELRTPLNAIGGYVDLITLGIRGPLTDAQREDLQRIRRNQRHLLGLINDILNYARTEAGRVEYNIGPVPLAEVVSDMMPMIEPQLAAKELVCEARLPDEEVRVAADREKLRQVLLNLLSNAIKYTPAGGRITIALRPPGDSASDEIVHLDVSDTGIGIPADKLETIFEPFVQVRSDLTATREGTGLGLAISRDLMHGMGGDLHARSTVGRGSTFTVELRRAE